MTLELYPIAKPRGRFPQSRVMHQIMIKSCVPGVLEPAFYIPFSRSGVLADEQVRSPCRHNGDDLLPVVFYTVEARKTGQPHLLIRIVIVSVHNGSVLLRGRCDEPVQFLPILIQQPAHIGRYHTVLKKYEPCFPKDIPVRMTVIAERIAINSINLRGYAPFRQKGKHLVPPSERCYDISQFLHTLIIRRIRKQQEECADILLVVFLKISVEYLSVIIRVIQAVRNKPDRLPDERPYYIGCKP